MVLLSTIVLSANAQNLRNESEKCGTYNKSASINEEDNWGYSYADLENDIEIWQQHELVEVTSFGKSVQDRELYMLTIQNSDAAHQYRITIHARTHPGEEESLYATKEIIRLLTEESELSNQLLDNCVFNIIPMINPDGVELNKPRENANDVDIESNWYATSPEPEVVALRELFYGFMESDLPVNIALNMHSAVACKRYFVCHHPNGTSQYFWQEQIRFVQAVQSFFPDGIEDYNYYVSWSGGAPQKYPESWFWFNYGEDVLALTYEDMNCSSAGDYDKTAFALLSGIQLYLMPAVASVNQYKKKEMRLYPNPAQAGGNIQVDLPGNATIDAARIISLDGRQIPITAYNDKSIPLPQLKHGMYILEVQTNGNFYRNRIIID